MIHLPTNLAGLARAASDDGRYALAAVRVIPCRDDWYRCEATDGKILAIVCGPPPGEAAAVIAAGDLGGAGEADGPFLVPAKAWEQAFKNVPKRRALALLPTANEVLLWTAAWVARVPQHEGRFPDLDQVLPRTPPLVRARVNAALLAEVCRLVAQIDPDGRGLELLFYGPDRPLGFMARNEQGQTLDGLLAPLT